MVLAIVVPITPSGLCSAQTLLAWPRLSRFNTFAGKNSPNNASLPVNIQLTVQELDLVMTKMIHFVMPVSLTMMNRLYTYCISQHCHLYF